MTFEETTELIKQNLPESIGEYNLVHGMLPNNIFIIEYSIQPAFAKYISGTSERFKTTEYQDKNVLFEVVSNSLEDCYNKMNNKIYLNKFVTKEFPYYKILGYTPNYKISTNIGEIPIKLFEIYWILDKNSDSQFLAVVSNNPISEIQLIIEKINQIRLLIKQKNWVEIQGVDFDYNDFNLPKRVHLYSNDFFQKKDDIRNVFKKNEWNISFKDKYSFEKLINERNEKMILCEGKNFKFLNNLKIDNVVFSEDHNSYTIFQNVKTQKRFCLRDKDYLTIEEIKRIKQKFPKYYILKYYCFENYLYHPENINELKLIGFSIDEYISEITSQKEKNLLRIIDNISLARKSYEELKDNNISKVISAEEDLVLELKSDNFEIFYQHFDMKSIFKKEFLSKYNLNPYKLSNTKWFKKEISTIIS
jgi:hypothetical protein